MSRIAFSAVLAATLACSKSPDKTAGAAPAETPPPVAARGPTPPLDDPKLHLQPEEGTLTVDKLEGKAGTEASARVQVTPAPGYHMSTEFPAKLTLEAPAGIKLAKAEQSAGKGEKGDAEAFSEQALAFAVKATADKAGTYEIKGWFKFGVCNKESCHPKKQPIAIAVAVN
jgi:hypothetical protein